MRVAIICVASIDGKISPGLVGSPLDRKHLESHRSQSDASLMGAETLRKGDVQMRCLHGRLPEKRIRAIITRSGDIPIRARRLFSEGPKPVVFTGRQALDALTEKLQDRARLVVIPEGPNGLSVEVALSELGRMGARSVLVEGGSRLNYAALSEGVVDEILLTLAPKISGRSASAALADGPRLLGNPMLELELLEWRAADSGELFLRYRVK